MKTETMKLNARDIALIGVMVAIIEVCKVAIAGIPNVELTSFWIIIFALYFGKHIYYAIPAFIIIEGLIYGFGLWWVMYLYAWPILAIVVRMMRKSDSAWTWAFVSGIFGLLFGFMCAIPYFFIGLADGGVGGGLRMAFAWWVAGIPWDLVHGVANFVIMLVLYEPMARVTRKFKYE